MPSHFLKGCQIYFATPWPVFASSVFLLKKTVREATYFFDLNSFPLYQITAQKRCLKSSLKSALKGDFLRDSLDMEIFCTSTLLFSLALKWKFVMNVPLSGDIFFLTQQSLKSYPSNDLNNKMSDKRKHY